MGGAVLFSSWCGILVDPESCETDGTEVLGVMRRVAVDRGP